MRVKHLNKGVSGLSTTLCSESVHSLCVPRQKPRPSIPLKYFKGRYSPFQGSGGPFVVWKGIEQSFQGYTSKENSCWASEENLVQGLTQKVRECLILS